MEIKYAIERIIDDIIILENIETGELEFIIKSMLDVEVNEKDIIIFKDNKFEVSIEETEKRLEKIREKFNRLKKN